MKKWYSTPSLILILLALISVWFLCLAIPANMAVEYILLAFDYELHSKNNLQFSISFIEGLYAIALFLLNGIFLVGLWKNLSN